jgi:glycosyltransferase involved in cell wall biosynthesis
MKKLSIIIPTYNVDKYIEQCLSSLLPQVGKNVEVIIIDDCSTDRTKEKIDKMINKYNRPVKFIRLSKNSGVSFARNMGLSLASGDYITFIDGDDAVSSEYIIAILQNLLLGFDYYKLSWSTMVGKPVVYRAKNLPDWNCSVWSRIFKSSIIQKEFDTSKKWAEDWQFLQDNIRDNLTCGYINDIIYLYRNDREGSLTQQMLDAAKNTQ